MKLLAPNTLLQNRYLVVHLIGKGGMGEVYLAVDQRLGSAIALKRTLHGDDVQLGDAFEREARTLARLRHPALPKVSDHFTENDNQYLVMDHISGDDLAKRLSATQKPFPLSWVLFWADQLLDALAYLHSHEPPIIHRDIKPQNLKLTDENNIVLLDFGLSKNSVNQTNLTSGSGSTGSVVGYTPHYAPMEQIRGTGTNPRSDIYSLSATLYQLLTNIVPPDALSRADSLLSGKPDPITPINEINGEVPKTISDVILKGMSISQDQRYGDAREMQKILRETYAQMQNVTAKNVAFNAQEEQAAPIVANQLPNTDLGVQTIPYGMMENKAEKVAEMPPPTPQKIEQNQDFDATIRVDSAPKNLGQETEILLTPNSVPQQSGIKTEVFNGDFGASDYLKNNEPAPPNFINEDLIKKEQTPLPPPPNITGDKTVPLITFEEHGNIDFAQTQPASAFDSIPQAETFIPTSEVAFPPEDYSPNVETFSEPVQHTNPPVQRQMPPPLPQKKKSKGLVFAVIGGLFGLLILAAGAFGIGWYLMNQPENPGLSNAATPTPMPSVSLTPEQTPEQINANTNNVGNSNSEIITNSNPNNSSVNTTPSPEKTKPVVTTQTPENQPTVKPLITPRPTQITVNTPRPQIPKTPKPNAKPDPKPTLRGTTIPQ
jgi:serine/threonine protein kinase